MATREVETTSTYSLRRRKAIREKEREVRRQLEQRHVININAVERMLSCFFSPGFLPYWYFHSHSAEDIAYHVIVITQMLNARSDYLRHASKDGHAVTYFINVGRDVPGKLLWLVEENRNMDIAAMDSVKSKSGIRIITMERETGRKMSSDIEERKEIDQIVRSVHEISEERGYAHTFEFFRSLPPNYLIEEANSIVIPPRIHRHVELFEQAIDSEKLVVTVNDTRGNREDEDARSEAQELRLAVATRHPGCEFLIAVLSQMRDNGINLNRSYFDTFQATDTTPAIGIISMYVQPTVDLEPVRRAIETMPMPGPPSIDPETGVAETLKRLVRSISDPETSEQDAENLIAELKTLAERNADTSVAGEQGNFLLNSLTDFFDGARFNGLYNSTAALRTLIAFDSFEEFWVEARRDYRAQNTEGYRVKHSSVRGPSKGGIRNDLIVDFDEVAALAFMMTWKCGRSRILFGGGKGGLKINPAEYKGRSIEFFDTLSNFGRSLFLVTGPNYDVPAGDLGCGPTEIGHMFEGFKSALRDLASLASGLKQSVAYIGDTMLSVNDARQMLEEHFAVDCYDAEILNELTTSEVYLELVVAAQITGKPRMGLDARTGATGRGLCYSILATVTNLYLEGRWEPAAALDPADETLLRRLAAVNTSFVLERKGMDILPAEDWAKLTTVTLVKLLEGKRVAVQGFGKVGQGLLKELVRYRVNVMAVSDIEGAIVAPALQFDELVRAVQDKGSVVYANVPEAHVVRGAAGNPAVLESDCDILIPAAVENAVTAENAPRIRATIEACGSNGPNTSKAERILTANGVTVIYDFLANGGGVIASYFEWLRGLAERYRYEAEQIRGTEFNVDMMDRHVMPEYRDRIKRILGEHESERTTTEWNALLRDIMFCALNEDFQTARGFSVSMRTAGFSDSQLRVLSAILLTCTEEERRRIWDSLEDCSRQKLQPYLHHPESAIHNPDYATIVDELYDT